MYTPFNKLNRNCLPQLVFHPIHKPHVALVLGFLPVLQMLICQDCAILVDLRGPGSEGQGLSFNVCVAPCDVHSAQLTQRDKGPSRNGEEWRED